MCPLSYSCADSKINLLTSSFLSFSVKILSTSDAGIAGIAR